MCNINSAKRHHTFVAACEIFSRNFAASLILRRSSPRGCQIPFVIGRGFAKVQILIKVKLILSLELFGTFR